jgi:LCP family protein required for cell wall assembly
VRRIAWGSGGVIAVVAILVVAALVVATSRFDLIGRLGADTRLDAAGDGEPRNYLVIGSDDRDNLDASDPAAAVFTGAGYEPSGRRADVIMVMRVDPGENTIDVLSVPRDLWVPISGTGEEQRINTAYAEGPQQMIDTIREDFGIQINNYLEIDFLGFKGLVDAVGGVPMWFDAPMRDPMSGLEITESGCVNLDGYQALAFVRARSLESLGEMGWETDPTGDAGRVSRQQVFMRRVADKAAGEVSLTDVAGLNRLADVAIDHVTIDATMQITRVIGLARQFGSVDDEGLTFHTLPTNRWFTPGGADVQLLDTLAAQPVLNVFRGLPPDATDERATGVQLSVLNGTGVDGQAAKVSEALTAVGFATGPPGGADGIMDRTVVRYGPGGAPAAALVARHLAGGADLAVDEFLAPGEVVLVTGGDFVAVLTVPMAFDDPDLAGRTGFEVLEPADRGDADDAASTGGTSDTGDAGDTGDDAGDATGGNGSANRDDTQGGSGASSTTTTTTVPAEPAVPGRVPGDPPPGVECR